MNLEQARWTPERINQWQHQQGWQCGFNYLPRTAVNFVDMWLAERFSVDLIREELTWAAQAGFNSLRTNLPFVLWKQDRDGLMLRIDQFLQVASELNFSVILCPLDDCEFSGADPVVGPQPAPQPGVHNSRAVGSPGRRWVMDESCHEVVGDYVADVLTTFGLDQRVMLWDLYNEPGNRMIFTTERELQYDEALEQHALALLETVFRRARDCNAQQPLTVAAWHMPAPWQPTPTPYYQHPLDQAALAWSDVISFHAYREPDIMRAVIDQLSAAGRPMMCTEWMARHIDSTIENQLGLLHEREVHCYQWGLVQGETQTHLPWPEVARHQTATQQLNQDWFHDLLHPDGTPRYPQEADVIRSMTGR